MELLRTDPKEAYLGLKAIKMVAKRDGTLTPAARNLLVAGQNHILCTDYDLDPLPPITLAELAEGFT